MQIPHHMLKVVTFLAFMQLEGIIFVDGVTILSFPKAAVILYIAHLLPSPEEGATSTFTVENRKQEQS